MECKVIRIPSGMIRVGLNLDGKKILVLKTLRKDGEGTEVEKSEYFLVEHLLNENLEVTEQTLLMENEIFRVPENYNADSHSCEERHGKIDTQSENDSFSYTWDFNRNSISGIGLTNSKEEAEKMMNSGNGYELLFPNPDSKEELSRGIYLLFSEAERDKDSARNEERMADLEEQVRSLQEEVDRFKNSIEKARGKIKDRYSFSDKAE